MTSLIAYSRAPSISRIEQVQLDAQNDQLIISYTKPSNTLDDPFAQVQQLRVSTLSSFYAVFMNVLAVIFPSFKEWTPISLAIQDQVYYVSRSEMHNLFHRNFSDLPGYPIYGFSNAMEFKQILLSYFRQQN